MGKIGLFGTEKVLIYHLPSTVPKRPEVDAQGQAAPNVEIDIAARLRRHAAPIHGRILGYAEARAGDSVRGTKPIRGER